MLDERKVQAMMDLIVENSAPGLGPEVIADVFDRLIWLLADNGAVLIRIVRGWLDEGSDLRRLRVALAMDEVFFYDRRSEMQDAFLRLTSRYPELDAACKRTLAAWDAAGDPAR
jgi:hypothetical protein